MHQDLETLGGQGSSLSGLRLITTSSFDPQENGYCAGLEMYNTTKYVTRNKKHPTCTKT